MEVIDWLSGNRKKHTQFNARDYVHSTDKLVEALASSRTWDASMSVLQNCFTRRVYNAQRPGDVLRMEAKFRSNQARVATLSLELAGARYYQTVATSCEILEARIPESVSTTAKVC